MNTSEIRKELNLTIEEFCDKFNIPMEIVMDWDSKDCMPDYVFNMVNNICSLEKKLNIWRSLYKKKII